ncbi:S41 family peptidase, partial [Planctomycetota bacterium]
LERITPGTEPWLLRPKARTPAPAIKEIQDGVYYVDLLKVKPKELEESIDVLAKARGVVFDYRGRPFQIYPEIVIRHLLQSEDTSDAWFMTPMITYPDFTNVTYKKEGWGLIPSEPHIRGKVVFLTNAAARCASECFLSFVEHYNLGEIVGQATAGYIGTMNTVKLPSGFKLIWTGQKVVKHDGSQHHLIGITPTVPVKRTIQGLIEGRDEYLEKALEIINE